MIKDMVGRFWRWLVEPSPAIQELERRQNVRLLISLLVTLLPLGLVITAISPLLATSEPVWQDQDFVALAGSVVFWVVIYLLGRAGRDELAAKLSMAVGSVAIFAAALGDENPWKINFLIIPVLMSSLLLSLRATFLLIIGHTVGILLLPVFNSDITLVDIIVGPLSFMGMATATILVSARHRDRLERIRQAELAQSESRYRDLFEATFEGIAIYDDGVLLDANPGLARIFGYPLAEIVGMSMCDLVEEGSRDLVARHVEAGDGQPTEARGLRRDGTSVKLELIARPQVIDGRAVRVIAVRDVTERLQMARALQRSVDEVQNLQQITETLLGLGELSQVINAVAEGIVTRLGFDMVLVSRYIEEENAFTGLALYPIPASEQFERFLNRIGRPELEGAPAGFQVPYQRGENPFVDRVLDGEVVITDAMANLFHPWVSRSAARFAQAIFHLQAFIDLPMQVKGKTVGTIVAGVRRDAIPADQRQALIRVAGQAAVAIENARLYEAERQRTVELARSYSFITALGQVAARIAVTPDLDQILQALGAELERIGITCFLILVESDTQQLRGRYASIESTALALAEKLAGLSVRGFQMSCEQWPIPEVIEEKRASYRPDSVAMVASFLPHLPRPLLERIARPLGVTSDIASIYLPLTVKDQLKGILALWGPGLQEEDIPALSVFANQVAVALENARLYEQAQQELVEREQVEAALRDSEERFRNIFENSPIGVYRTTSDGQILMANAALVHMLGFSSFEELAQRNLEAEGFGPGYPRTDFKRRIGRSGQVVGYESTWVRKDGSMVFVRESARSIDAEQNKLYYEGTVEDITERKQAEAERERLLTQIQEQAQHVQQIVDTVPEGMLLLDADGRVILANPMAVENLLSMTGIGVGDIFTRLGDCPLSELLASPPQGLWHEVTVGARSFQVIARPVESGPATEQWVLVVRDVTQEREVQRRVQQQERLATVGQLAAGIAHDFNNIMATIVLYAQMMAKRSNLSERDRERLGIINQQAQHATNLVQQILDFSRRAVLERRPLDLVMLSNEQIRLLERTLPESIEITLAYGSTLSEKERPGEYAVNGDPTRLQQVMMNLALNARDAMPYGGELRFNIERIRVVGREDAPLSEMEAGEWVQLTVADTGTGIPPDALPHVFDPFFTTKSPGKGTGLGLAQVYGIVKAHEGAIGVRSQPDEGTIFTICLPALPVYAVEPSAIETSDLTRGRGETVLVVEDSASTRQALVESLELLNYRVVEASNGREALELLDRRGQEVALVVSDVVMPEMGGIALLEALGQRGLTVKVVLLTGHPLEHELENLRKGKAGALLVDWLPKPPSLEELGKVVARGLEE